MKNTRIFFWIVCFCVVTTFISCEKENENLTIQESNVVLDSNEILSLWIEEALQEQPLVKTKKPLETVDFVAIDRYTGRWFELANFPTRFNENCSCTTADYAPIPEGISVLNNCTSTVTGEFNTIAGRGIVVDPETNAILQVFLGNIPFPGDYWIIDLVAFDKDGPYDFAVVSEPERESLFILSRKPKLNTLKDKFAVIKILVNLLKQGFDIRKLQISPQLEDCTYI